MKLDYDKLEGCLSDLPVTDPLEKVLRTTKLGFVDIADSGG